MLWSENEQARLIEMWPQHKLQKIAIELGRSYSSVRSAIDRYRLRRTKLNLWRADEIASVLELWPLYSAAQIAERFGRTRNAVIGIVNRQRRAGVEVKHGPKQLLRRPAPLPAPNRNPRKRTKPMKREPISCPCQLIELESTNCKWPFGDPRQPGFYFCGAVIAPDRPYCPAHCDKSYQRGPYEHRTRTFIAKPVFNAPGASTGT